jgi:peptidoglycan/LPS O-acetylase OafA/YrhL
MADVNPSLLPQSKARMYGLDVLRALAITYVMFSHGYEYSGKVISDHYYKWLILDGVGLFFVLSGFLIGGILIRKTEAGTFSLKQLFDFWIRRWLRTIPAYFFVLIFLIGCYYVSHKQLPPVWAKYVVFIQNFASPHPLFFGEAWSLSVEEWFYLLLPLMLFFLLKLPGKKQHLILICIMLVLVPVICFRRYKIGQHDYFSNGTFSDQIMKVVITRLDAIVYGVLGAWIAIYHSRKFYAYKKTFFVAGVILLICTNAFVTPFLYTRIYPSLIPLATLCLLPALNTLKERKGFIARILTFISIISYAMYLTNHMIVQRGIMPFIIKWFRLDLAESAMHNGIAYILFWILTIAAAYALHRLIEKPFMEIRKRWVS